MLKALRIPHCRDNRSELLNTVKTRRLSLSDANLRFQEPSGNETTSHTFEGYAVKWNSVNTYGEKFAKGAFAEMIRQVEAGDKVVHMYYNHGWRNMFDSRAATRIGRWIEFVEDDTGLLVKGELTRRLSLAEDVAAMMQHGTVDGLSIAFYPVPEMDLEEHDDHILIKRVDLYEISPVDEPSDRNARINRQSETINNLVDKRDAVDMLTNLGLDDAAARQLLVKLDDILDRDDSTDTVIAHDPLAFLDD